MISQSLRFPYRVPILMTTQSLWCPLLFQSKCLYVFQMLMMLQSVSCSYSVPILVISHSVECPFDFPTLYDDQILKVPINVLIWRISQSWWCPYGVSILMVSPWCSLPSDVFILLVSMQRFIAPAALVFFRLWWRFYRKEWLDHISKLPEVFSFVFWLCLAGKSAHWPLHITTVSRIYWNQRHKFEMFSWLNWNKGRTFKWSSAHRYVEWQQTSIANPDTAFMMPFSFPKLWFGYSLVVVHINELRGLI